MLKKTLLAGMAFFMVACGNSNKEEKSTGVGSVVEGVSNLSKMSNAAEKMEEQTNALKKMTPLSNEELKAVVPETLAGLPRKSFSAGALGATGLSSIDATYGDDSKYVKVGVMDGAGETGSALVSLMAMTLSMDSESESDGTKTKTTTVNGIRSVTEETKTDQSTRSSIKYLYKNRYSISLDGEGYTLEELGAFMKGLNTSALK